MKIIEYEICVWDGPKENSGIISKDNLLKYKEVYDFTQDPPVLIYTKTDQEVYIEWEKSEINQFAQEYIYKYYPSWKQSNILREGTEQDILKMSTFINAVRDWSNQEKPDPWSESLTSIVP